MGTKGNYLGEFEELILLAVASLEDAYGVAVMKYIDQEAGRKVNISAIHQGLRRLQNKGLVSSHVGGATQVRGGRSKRFFELSEAGRTMLKEIIELKIQLYQKVPNLSTKPT